MMNFREQFTEVSERVLRLKAAFSPQFQKEHKGYIKGAIYQ